MQDYNFPGYKAFLESIEVVKEEDPLQYGALFDKLINFCEMVMITFSCLTLRCYEDIFANEPDEYKKKINPIKKIIRERFKAPSFGTILELTRNCFHLIREDDGICPVGLIKAKDCLDQNIKIGPVSFLLNDFNKVSDVVKSGDRIKRKTIYREQSRLHILGKLLPQIVEVRNTVKHSRDLSVIISDEFDNLKLNIDYWTESLKLIIKVLSPIISHEYTLKTLGKASKKNKKRTDDEKSQFSFLIDTVIYSKDQKNELQDEQSFSDIQDLQDFQKVNYSEIILKEDDGNKAIDLFPFLMIEDDKLFFYKATKAKGYEYFTIADNSTYLIETKKKFSYSAFKIGEGGDEQAFFWTEVFPSTNTINNITANIPIESLVDFVGRKKLIKKIKEEILEIANLDGILFAPGGVGKTALMLKLSKELFDEKDNEKVLFSNIIWVTAKKDYYNPFLDFVEKKDRQIETLDNIFSAILAFFEYKNSEEYGFEDKQSLALEILMENKTLLIIDNFETISKIEQEKIIRFFGITVKKYLRKKPDQFKIIMTSREQIPSGFHQIKLEGLDLSESKQLINKLYIRYKGSSAELTNDQKKLIHKASSGIPIIIKHCIGQIFEYNKPIESVCLGLCDASSEVVKFSYDEIFKLLRKNESQLEVVILLELANCPLSSRQISDILEIDEMEIKSLLPSLLNFQCLDRINVGTEEKYSINDNVGLLSKGLLHKEDKVQKKVKSKIIKNFTLDKKMDYTSEEMNIIEIFNKYLAENNYIEAEDFLSGQLKRHKNSILLKYHFAKYLKEQKREIDSAVELLKSIDKDGFKHPSILRLMISCYISMDIPKYDRAKKYVNELKSYLDENDQIKIEIAEFYIGWSTFIKLSPRCIDPIKEMERKNKYKEIALLAIDTLKQVSEDKKDQRYYYLLSHGYFNMWKNHEAHRVINVAIKKSSPSDFRYMHSCQKLKNIIEKYIKV